jgi:hypothetical protein
MELSLPRFVPGILLKTKKLSQIGCHQKNIMPISHLPPDAR